MKNDALSTVAFAQCVEVALIGPGGAPSSLTYAVPDALAGAVFPGAGVTIPLGQRRLTGIVLGPTTGVRPARLRPIIDLLPDHSVPQELLKLASWAARYYHAPLGSFFRALLPPSVRTSHRRLARPIKQNEHADSAPTLSLLATFDARLLERLPDSGLDVAQLRAEFGPAASRALKRLAARGLVAIEDVAVERRAEQTLVRASMPPQGLEPSFGRARRQREIYGFVSARRPHAVSRAELEQRFPGGARLVVRLIERGLLAEVRASEQAVSAGEAANGAPPAERELRSAQAAAVRTLTDALGGFATFLLFGVTGSGKTEVYLRAAAAACATGSGILLLVPEIALTHQLVSETYRRFGGSSSVAVLHSALVETERWRTWRDIAAGRSPVVIGARSAVFAPIPRLGLIVVDEEHDAAYKQEESPRYNARDLAVMRAKLAGCPVVLASATPALESYHAALAGKYRLLELPERANAAPLPTVHVIDLRDRRAELRCAEPAHTSSHDPPQTTGPRAALAPDKLIESGARLERRRDPFPLSATLEQAIVATYRAGEQTLLFLNRRGYARFIQCAACGHVETCPNCSVSLTVHRARSAAVCHHCGFARRPSGRCPSCDSVLNARSFGTEQVEAAVRELLPAARIARLDRDSSGAPGFVRRTVQAWRAGELDVLVGTQMIAKGHDVPGVTLIGVILADASLNFPDFRAGERTFQLLAQVAGRAGRGSKPGRVLVQTYQPEHPSLIAASRHDFTAFAARELTARAELRYPPHGRLTRILVEGEEREVAERAADLAERLGAAARAIERAPTESNSFARVLGPAPAPIEKLRGRYRMQLLLKADGHRTMARLLARAGLGDRGRASREVRALRVVVDVDPLSML